MWRMQRWIAGATALVGLVGLVLAGCGSSHPGSPTSASAPPHSAGAPHTTGCSGSQLTLSYAGTEGATGHLELHVAVRNSSQSAVPVARLPRRPAARRRGPAAAPACRPPRRLLPRHRVRAAGGGAQAGSERPLRDQPRDQQRVQGRAGLPDGGGRHALGAGIADALAAALAAPGAARRPLRQPARRLPRSTRVTRLEAGQPGSAAALPAPVRACSPASPAHGA